MLWYKGWLETRFRLLFMLLYAVFPIFLFTAVPRPAESPNTLQAVERTISFFAVYYSVMPMMLAGSGIKTQSSFRSTKGLHGSMHFTLSMPVSRFRLLATRAGLGMLETAVVLAIVPCAVWIIFPSLRMQTTSSDLLAYWVTFNVCASSFYFLGVLLSTFLDEIWQNWISMFGIVFLWRLLSKVPLPASLDIFRAMGEYSPLFTHSFPWASMCISLTAAAILFLAAARVVQTREY